MLFTGRNFYRLAMLATVCGSLLLGSCCSADHLQCVHDVNKKFQGSFVVTRGTSLCLTLHNENFTYDSMDKDSKEYLCRKTYDTKFTPFDVDKTLLKTLFDRTCFVLSAKSSNSSTSTENNTISTCDVVENGKELIKKNDDCLMCDNLLCVYPLMDICTDVGPCVYTASDSSCLVNSSFFFKHLFPENFNCEPNCHCNPCKKSTWSKWYLSSKTNQIKRSRPFDKFVNDHCLSEPNECCYEIIKHCLNEGKLNEQKSVCSCPKNFRGIICEEAIGSENNFSAIIGTCVFFLIAILITLVYLLYFKKKEIQRIFKRLKRIVQRKPVLALGAKMKMSSITRVKSHSEQKSTTDIKNELKDYEIPIF